MKENKTSRRNIFKEVGYIASNALKLYTEIVHQTKWLNSIAAHT